MFELLLRELLIAVWRFLALETMWCEAAAAVPQSYAEIRVPFIAAEPVLDAAVAGEDFVVVSGESSDRRLLRSTPRDEPEVLMPTVQRVVPGGEYLFARGSRWWYGVAVKRNGVQGTYFVSEDGSSSVIPVSGQYLSLWIPLKIVTPRALVLSMSDSGMPVATEIDTNGPVRTWQLPMDLGRLASAELLPDGRIAVVTNDKDSRHLTLLLLADDDRIEIISLGYKMAIQLATAVDSQGRVAIATSTTDRRVDGTVIDLSRVPMEPKWRELRQGSRVTGGLGELQVASVSDGFAVAWVNRSESPPRLETGNLHASHGDGAFLNVGAVADRGGGAVFSLRSEDGEPVFTWDDGFHIMTRRLPASIAGYLLIERMAEAYCGR